MWQEQEAQALYLWAPRSLLVLAYDTRDLVSSSVTR